MYAAKNLCTSQAIQVNSLLQDPHLRNTGRFPSHVQ